MPTPELLAAHRAYMDRPDKPAYPEDEARCLRCECPGNNKCGHECLAAPEHYCELDINAEDDYLCYCCHAVLDQLPGVPGEGATDDA
ncbi:MAG: hypothetical protein IMZ50_09990 [Candidatus Atribacteria bacterium]|nr:hypothetical protein [Candidatus Atribacteria bacterium]